MICVHGCDHDYARGYVRDDDHAHDHDDYDHGGYDGRGCVHPL